MNYYDILLAKKLEDDRDPKVEGLSVTENGVYSEEGKVYKPVVVNVALPENTYFLKSATAGNIITFNDGADAPLNELVCNIEPVQSGSGDPSPTNVRPISGFDEVEVNVSDADTSNPTVYTVTLPDTIYGGTLDVTTGLLTVDRAEVDLGTLNWTYVTASSTFYADDDLNEKRTTGITVKCDRYLAVPNISDVYAMQVDNSICVRSVADEYHRVYVKDRRFTNAEDFTTAVAGAQLVYELATPQTYQLTPTAVKSLLGYNNIYTNCGDITSLQYFSRERG